MVLVLNVMGLSGAFAEEVQPRTFCRFVPEREDDFAWENDKIAFRAYGPALREGSENGGVDCWLKRVDYPVIDKWYKKHVAGGTYHKDDGEGYDPYHVGASLGCGGIGLWLDNSLVTSETFTGWKVLECEANNSAFELSYEWKYEGHTYQLVKHISIDVGDRLFTTVATIRKDGNLARGLPVAVGLTTHDGKAEAVPDVQAGWIACWETIDGSGLGTGVMMDPKKITEYKLIDSDTADESHALFISKTDDKGQVTWCAGYGWERAGEIKTRNDWLSYLSEQSKK
ncbi:MAG: DUF4861 family protein [Pontiellaceae bacterium]|nr:DUF4861 family protein [Pontiellaceae bacterium]MBN2785766.1 DUF4861 family protein [Pontiellaceae bacterium]